MTTGRHRSLDRQLRRLGLCADAAPDAGSWARLLDLVSTSYTEADADRYTLERSIDISGSEMRALHELLSGQAHRDALTGLPNRLSLLETLGDVLARQRAGGRPVAVLFIDLDGFKLVNDGLGHAAGDELLARAAERIRGAIRDGDVVARIGGDEFVVLAQDVGELETATAVAQRVVRALEAPFRIGSSNAAVSASVGVTHVLPGSALTADEALREADMAMYRAKTNGRCQYAVYSDVMRAEVDHQLTVREALRGALDGGELVVHYQPIVALADGEVLGLEALVRWQRPGVGLVLPDEFLPVAHATRLITGIDAFVLRQACRDAASWPSSTPYVAVNLSARDLGQDSLVEGLCGALQRSGLPPQRLVVELTEASLTSTTAVAANLARVRALGVRVAIDDFGTGSSSFAALRQLPTDVLKLDPVLVTSVGVDPAAAALVGAVVAMAHALGQTVVAEGVETPEQAQALRGLGCDAAQGHLFAAACPVGALPSRIVGRPVREPAVHVA